MRQESDQNRLRHIPPFCESLWGSGVKHVDLGGGSDASGRASLGQKQVGVGREGGFKSDVLVAVGVGGRR